MKPKPDATDLLLQSAIGEPRAAREWIPLVYDELHAIARVRMRSERADHTLQPTALVHEAFARLIDDDRVDWNGRAHFFRTAAETLRRVLVDHARARRAERRGGSAEDLSLHSGVLGDEGAEAIDLLALDEALVRLEEKSERQAEVVKLRFFAGLTVEEVAENLGLSTVTIKADWRVAKAWLKRWMDESE